MMMDMRCVVFVRSKRPTPEMVALANENHIAVLASGSRMYEACGKLFSTGWATRPAEDGGKHCGFTTMWTAIISPPPAQRP
jgi:hypothetical protein